METGKQTTEDLEEAIKGIRTRDLQSALREYEDKAAGILRAKGYPDSFQELRKLPDSELPDQVYHTKYALSHIMMVREHLNRGDAEKAAFSAISLAESAILADWTVLGRPLRSGATSIAKGKIRGQGQTEGRQPVWRKWRERSDELKRTHPGLSKSDRARSIKKKFAGTEHQGAFNTIRQVID